MAKKSYVAAGTLITGIITSTLTSLTTGSNAISAAIINIRGNGSGSNGAPKAILQLSVTLASAPSVTQMFSVWVLRSIDGGTTFGDGSTTITPARPPDGYFHLRPVNTAQVVQCEVKLPPGQYKVLVQNNTGVSTGAGSYTLDLYPVHSEIA